MNYYRKINETRHILSFPSGRHSYKVKQLLQVLANGPQSAVEPHHSDWGERKNAGSPPSISQLYAT